MSYYDEHAKKWRADAFYDFVDVDDMKVQDAKAHEAAGKHSGSSGCGFGARDLQFYFDSKQEADEAQQRLVEAGFRPTRSWACEE